MAIKDILALHKKAWYSQRMERGNLKQNGVHLKKHEYSTVQVFLDMGLDVELIPPSPIKGLKMPDVMIFGIPWEMKSPEGNGKKTIKNTVQNASHQSENVIVDLRRCPISEQQAMKELQRYFTMSRRLKRMKVITKDKIVLDLKK